MAENLTHAERLVRIGKILAKGIGRSRILNQEEPYCSLGEGRQARHDENPRIGDDSLRILRFLKKVRRASPLEIRNRFGLSRTTAYRRLKGLEKYGLVTRCGRTRDVVYEIAAWMEDLPH